MSYNATVLRVMIASPSDVSDARDAVESAIHSWNDSNARNKKIILQPWRWESGSVPILGSHPQKLINAQGVDDSDIVIALFGGRLGSPTPDAISGTAEEINRALELNKPVHLYFSTAPLPYDIETSQLDAVREFKKSMLDRGLLGEFNNTGELGYEVWKAIEHDISSLKLEQIPVSQQSNSGVKFLVQPRQEREVSGSNKNGSPRYRTRRWLEVTNEGLGDATEVSFENVGENSPLVLGDIPQQTTIHSGQMRQLSYALLMGGEDDPIIKITWAENGEKHQKEFHIG